jgi:hypothetical protein
MHCPLALAHTFKYLARAIGDDDKAEAELFRVALEFLRVVLNVDGDNRDIWSRLGGVGCRGASA